LVMSSEMW